MGQKPIVATGNLLAETVRRLHASVLQTRVLRRPLLVAEIDPDKPVALAVPVDPFEVVHRDPDMRGAYAPAVGDGADELGQHGAEKSDAEGSTD